MIQILFTNYIFIPLLTIVMLTLALYSWIIGDRVSQPIRCIFAILALLTGSTASITQLLYPLALIATHWNEPALSNSMVMFLGLISLLTALGIIALAAVASNEYYIMRHKTNLLSKRLYRSMYTIAIMYYAYLGIGMLINLIFIIIPSS